MAKTDNKGQKLKAHNSGHVQELKTLFKISQILITGIGQRQALAEVLDILDSELGMNKGTVTILAADSNQITIEVAHHISEEYKQRVRYRMGEGVTGKVMQTGKPMIVPKISKEPSFLNLFDRSDKIKEEISFICVPISIGKEIIGTISVDKLFDETRSLDEDMRIVSIVASMIATDVKTRREAGLQQRLLEDENVRLRHKLEDRFRPENIIGNSNAMRDVYCHVHQVAGRDTTVLIRGESGTGKELVAHAVHYSSPRAQGPFVKVNCAALNENLLESELFGHEKGAFTGAIQSRKGRIEQAQNGTLFLDEIGDFSPATQVKLLRVLQEREYQRVGSNKTLKSNARILVATNHDLETAVEDRSDILQLADFFVEQYAQKMNKDVRRISTPAINMMAVYHWPGNVRELENCIERAVLLSTDNVIHGHHLPPTLQTSDASDTIGIGSFAERVNLFERDIIVDALKRSNGKLTGAARDLKTTPRIIQYKVRELGIDYKRYRRTK